MVSRSNKQRNVKSIDGILLPKQNNNSINKKIAKLVKRPTVFLFSLLLSLAIGLLIGHVVTDNKSKYIDPNIKGINELKVVEQDVGRHYLLPINEVPALATVANKAKLTSPFFKEAENGDKILIYQTNQIAIIYRPSIDKIISVGPVSFSSTNQ